VTRKERLIPNGLTSDHVVQFFDTTESRADAISAFLADGFRNDDHLLVIAGHSHWRAIAPQLRQRASTSRLSAQQITVLDAGMTLSCFMRRGLPDSELFHKVIGEPVHHLAANRGGLRIYGEMVDLLAEEGNYHAAARLEELWNEVLVRHSLVLLCGYSAAHFTSSGTREALHRICRTHTRVQAAAADPLGRWVLSGSPVRRVSVDR
jgi:MEDS: MEthanogen/methylotroph, DcmR Sensory domain